MTLAINTWLQVHSELRLQDMLHQYISTWVIKPHVMCIHVNLPICPSSNTTNMPRLRLQSRLCPLLQRIYRMGINRINTRSYLVQDSNLLCLVQAELRDQIRCNTCKVD